MIGIRAFIGIDFESDFKKYIHELQQRLRKYAVRGRWKYSDNFHLTLKFLDEINTKQQKQIDDALNNICMEQCRFRLETEGLGIFEGRDSIRVLWLGLAGDLQLLQSLVEEIDKSLDSIGFPMEKRRFIPHITIGQDIVFECPFDHIRDSIGQINFSPINVTALTLFKSEQIQNKRIYSKISDYYLKQL